MECDSESGERKLPQQKLFRLKLPLTPVVVVQRADADGADGGVVVVGACMHAWPRCSLGGRGGAMAPHHSCQGLR